MLHYNVRKNNPNWNGGKSVDYRGRVLVLNPENGRSNNKGYVFEHLLIAEKVLGRPLTKKEPVHHFNLNPSENINSNLVICNNHAYHSLLHRRQRALSESSHIDWVKCKDCGGWGKVEIMTISDKLKHRNVYIHKSCNAKKARVRRIKLMGGDSYSAS